MPPPVLPGPPNGIQLDSLDPDVDGDGKVSALERKLHGKLRAADRDANGVLDVREFYAVLFSFIEVEKKKRMYQRTALFFLGLSILLAGTTLGSSTAAALLAKDQCVAIPTHPQQPGHKAGLRSQDSYYLSACRRARYVERPSGGDHPLVTDESGAVLAAARAETKLPLAVTPVVPMARLATVDRLELSYTSERSAAEDGKVNASYSVIGVEVFSNTSAAFTLATGGTVVLEGGLATYIDSGGTSHRVCASDITCSAFSVSDPVDAQILIQRAEDALSDLHEAEGERRRLSYSEYQGYEDQQCSGTQMYEVSKRTRALCRDWCERKAEEKCYT